jgi:gamma-glutamylcyclotransferase (GGCT)/AIG2-like uncharacterized protein YtfP
MTERVFVYGTLRTGASNAWRMAGSRLLGPGTVRGRLYRVAWYPALVLDPRAGEVRGELHDVPCAMLPGLDRFEGVSAAGEGSEYRRIRARVTLPGGSEVEAWVWEWRAPMAGLPEISDGEWRE